MAFSKTFLLLGLVFAIVLILSPQVSARELADPAQTQGSVEDDKHGHYHHHHHHHGHHHHGHHHHGHHGHHGGHGHHGEPGHDDAGEN